MLTNLLIIGSTSPGKTAYIRRLEQDWESKQYEVEGRSYGMMFDIDHYAVGHVHIYDSCMPYVANDIYDCAIIMCAEVVPDIEKYKEQIKEKCGDIPIMILFNKYELENVKAQYQSYLKDHPDDLVRYCSVHDENIGQVENTFREIVELTLD